MVASNPPMGSDTLCFLSTQEHRAEAKGPLNKMLPHPCSPPGPLPAHPWKCAQELVTSPPLPYGIH